MIEIIVGKTTRGGVGKFHTVNNAGVHQFIGHNQSGAEGAERSYQSGIGMVTAIEQQSGTATV